MRRALIVAVVLVISSALAATQNAPSPRAVLDQYCITCHNEKLRTAGLALDKLDVVHPNSNAEIWERVIEKLRAGSMPPPGRPRPDTATYRAVATWLENEIDRAWAANPNPGRIGAVHRLNRTEYSNAIRDLFDVTLDVRSQLPGDETADGSFDNFADSLSISTAHLERYLSVARQVTRLATGLPPTSPTMDRFEIPLHVLQDERQSEDLPFGSRGGIAVKYDFPIDGEYLIKIRLQRQYQDYIKGMGWHQQLDIRLDGSLLKRFTVGGACDNRILSRIARLAYRRHVTQQDVQTLLEFFNKVRSDGGTFDAGIQFALERLLVDPDFLLRVHRDSKQSESIYRLSDLEIASRLSFFLWSSIPDERLLDFAERGQLSNPQTLERETRRMLADPRAIDSLVTTFAGQWLNLRRVEETVVDPGRYPNYDESLLQGFQRETELFIGSTIREDRSVTDLLNADYTFVNERLARHYGIPGVYGSRFRRVTLPNHDQRGGLLAQGALLATTSYPDRTSPVLRGKFLLNNILGLPVPPPPAGVDTNLTDKPGAMPKTIREKLAQHRTNPTCNGCHSVIDPLGFTLENFDVIGGWRTVDEAGRPVDATGETLAGAKIEGLRGLRALLLDDPEQFPRTVTEKLMAYALGRRVEYYDRPAVRKIVHDAAAQNYRWSSLIIGIVKSPSFLMRSRG